MSDNGNFNYYEEDPTPMMDPEPQDNLRGCQMILLFLAFMILVVCGMGTFLVIQKY